jgi:hypothetical protein
MQSVFTPFYIKNTAVFPPFCAATAKATLFGNNLSFLYPFFAL